MQSEIRNRRRARQIIDFKNIRIGEKGMPTDCDGLIEYHDKAYVLFEIKHGKKDVPVGQCLVLVRMCDDFARISKPAVFIVAEHEVDDPAEDIDVAACIVAIFIGGTNGINRPDASRPKRRSNVLQISSTGAIHLNKIFLSGCLTKELTKKKTPL